MRDKRKFDTLNDVYNVLVNKVSQISSVDAKIDTKSSDFTRKLNTIRINIFLKTLDYNDDESIDRISKLIDNTIYETREKNLSLKANTSYNGNNLVKNEFNTIEDDSTARIRIELRKIHNINDRIEKCRSEIERLNVENMELQNKAVVSDAVDESVDKKGRGSCCSCKSKGSKSDHSTDSCREEYSNYHVLQELEVELKNRISELEEEIRSNSKTMLSQTTKINRSISRMKEEVDELSLKLTNLERRMKYTDFQLPKIIQPSVAS